MPAVLLPRAAGFLRRPQITHFVPSAAAQTSVRRFFRFIRHPTSYICCSYFSRKAARLRCGLIYHSRAPAHFFCAIDISVIFSSDTGLMHPRRWDTLCFFSGAGCKCLQNYCKFCCSFHPASPFSMQPVEVYMLHSFSSEVYSFQQWRQIRHGKQSNICTFLSCITTICVFLFCPPFVIIIVYNGVCAEPPCKTMFLIIFRRRTKMSKAISRRDFMNH